MTKNHFLVSLAFMSTLLLTGNLLADEIVKVGTTAGPDLEILAQVQKVAVKFGLIVEIVEYEDYLKPNQALAEKDIDLNSFQHAPFLEYFETKNGYKFAAIANTYIAPIGFFSKKISSMDDLRKGDSLVIPDDPINGGRALLLLQRAGLIRLKSEAGQMATLSDITFNRLGINIITTAASQTASFLDDNTVAAVNANFMVGSEPPPWLLVLEDVDSPYVNVIVARRDDLGSPLHEKFIKAYQSADVAQFMLSRFEGTIVPVFNIK